MRVASLENRFHRVRCYAVAAYMARMAAQRGGEVSERKRKRHYGFWIIHTKSYVSRLLYYRVVSKRTIFLVNFNIDDRDLRLSDVEKRKRTRSIWLSGTASVTSCTFIGSIILRRKRCKIDVASQTMNNASQNAMRYRLIRALNVNAQSG